MCFLKSVLVIIKKNKKFVLGARNTRKSHFGSTSRAASRKRQQANAMQFASEAKTKQACFKVVTTIIFDFYKKRCFVKLSTFMI